MATPEEPFVEDVRVVGTSSDLAWRSGSAVLPSERAAARADWLSFMLGLMGRRAPRRPALTAEA